MDMRARLVAAAALVYAENGYRGATTRRIAQAAGVNEVTIFRHFGSKAALLTEAIHERSRNGTSEGLPAVPARPDREVTAWAQALMRHLVEQRALIRTCMGEMSEHPEIVDAARAQPERAMSELQAYVGRLQATNLARRDFTPAGAAGMLIGAVFSEAVSRDLMPAMYARKREENVAEYVRLFLRAIGVEAGARQDKRNGRKRTR